MFLGSIVAGQMLLVTGVKVGGWATTAFLENNRKVSPDLKTIIGKCRKGLISHKHSVQTITNEEASILVVNPPGTQ